MQVTILGGAGFLGRKLAQRLAQLPEVDGLVLFDQYQPAPIEAPFPVTCLAGDVADPAAVARAIPPGTTTVFHLAAVVSAAAEADYDLGVKVNIHGTLAVLQACRALETCPRVVFTSSVASFGGGQQAMVPDDGRQVPTNSYGAQKAIGELLLADASRRGFLDAVSIRLPTVIIRPGRPNRAASSFASAVLREPLLGLETTYPVPESFKVWICSPRQAVDWFLHAATMDTDPLGLDRGINPPGLSASIAEMLAALEQAGGGKARALVRREPDPEIQAIVAGWPAAFSADRARSLGFTEQPGLEAIVAAFLEDDLAATRADRGLT
jgi:nucleoside-diphosphate-sugar epimerase